MQGQRQDWEALVSEQAQSASGFEDLLKLQQRRRQLLTESAGRSDSSSTSPRAQRSPGDRPSQLQSVLGLSPQMCTANELSLSPGAAKAAKGLGFSPSPTPGDPSISNLPVSISPPAIPVAEPAPGRRPRSWCAGLNRCCSGGTVACLNNTEDGQPSSSDLQDMIREALSFQIGQELRGSRGSRGRGAAVCMLLCAVGLSRTCDRSRGATAEWCLPCCLIASDRNQQDRK